MKLRRPLLGAALVAVASTGFSADPDPAELHKQVNELNTELQQLKKELKDREKDPKLRPVTKRDLDGLRSDLENYKYDQQQDRERRTTLSRRSVTVSGNIQTRATWVNPETTVGANTPAAERHTTFDVPNANVTFNGSLYRDYAEGRNLDFRLQFNYLRNNPANNNSQFVMSDAFLVYSFFPTTGGLEDPKLTATFGQQQIPFGLEAQVGEELRPVINSAQFLSGLGVGTRQIGVILRGDYKPYVDYGFNYRAPLIEYALGVVNGNGFNKSDDNEDKDVIARTAFTLPVDYHSWFRELKLGTSYYKGKVNRIVANVVQDQVDREIFGYDVYYNHNPFGITYEYAEGKTEGVGQPDAESEGQYVTLYYTWGEQWVRSIRSQGKYDDWWPKSYQAFARWDEYDPNKLLDNDSTVISTIGLNFFFAETTKFQFNLSKTDYELETAKNSYAAIAQFQFGF